MILGATIGLWNIRGRIDHHVIHRVRQHLIVPALENDAVEAVGLGSKLPERPAGVQPATGCVRGEGLKRFQAEDLTPLSRISTDSAPLQLIDAFMGTWMAFPIALFAGALVTVQAGSNAQLKQSFGSAAPALLVNYVLGIIVVFGYTLAARVPWPTIDRIGTSPWWAWIGGLSGAAYGVAVILLANQLGAATLMALAVSGQLLVSVAFDHFGLLGFETHPAGWARLAGCILMICGFILISKF